MTGFGNKQGNIDSFGKLSVELRSANHKFLDIVLHLPEGFTSLEEKVKKAIESKVKRGRVTCVISMFRQESSSVQINENLLAKYVSSLNKLKRKFCLKGDFGLETLIHLPGVLSLVETGIPRERVSPRVERLLSEALEDMVKMRKKEGRALEVYLKRDARKLSDNLAAIELRAKEVAKKKCLMLQTDEERANFLKECDIAEELDRLNFHVRNFTDNLSKPGPVGKEMDFIAQEMQREANTIGAKCLDSLISGRVVQLKSQIEKLREQIQNVE